MKTCSRISHPRLWPSRVFCFALACGLLSCKPPAEKARLQLTEAHLPVSSTTAVNAAQAGNTSTLELLRTAGVDLTAAPAEHSATPLITAIKAHSGALSLLVEATPAEKIDALDEAGRTALSHAISAGQPDLIRSLLAKSAQPTLSQHPGSDLLSDALLQKLPADLFAQLIDHCPTAHPLLTPALVTAVKLGDQNAIQLLLAHYAPAQTTAPSGESLLALAASQRTLATLNQLITAGAKAPADLTSEGNPLIHAVNADNLEMAKLLLQAGYSPDAHDHQGGTPTGLAASQRRLSLLALFLDHQAAPQPHLQSALTAKDFPVLDLLLQHEASLDLPDAVGDPPLLHAVLKKDVDLTRYLLSKQAPLDALGQFGQPAFLLAVTTGPRALVEVFLENGADPNATFRHPASQEFLDLTSNDYFNTWMGKDCLLTPLMLAASRGDVEMMRLLMKHGAKRSSQTKGWQRYPVNFACETSQIPAARLLLGQDPDDPRDVKAIVSLSKQRAWIYKDGKVVRSSDISTGKSGFTTPSGKYVISDKQADWKSSIYKVPMPYFMRLSCKDFGLHAGVVNGSGHASHGCVRLPKDQAEAFFAVMQIGDPVIIEN